MREPAYTFDKVQLMIEGWVRDRGTWREAKVGERLKLRQMPDEPTWADARSFIECHGTVEREEWVEVLDLERAITALRQRDPTAALVIIATAWGYDKEEMKATFEELGEPWGRVLTRGEHFIADWLSGSPAEAEAEWSRRRRRRAA